MPQKIYSARWRGPTLIEQGKAESLSVAIERDGAAAPLVSGTLTIYNAAGTKIIDAVAGTVAAGVFTFPTIGATVFDAETLGPNYLIQVDVDMGAEGDFRFMNDMVLCLAQLYPTVGQTDLVQRHSEAAALLGATVTSLQQYIDQAWSDITTRLYLESVEFWTWRTPAATRQVLFDRALELLFFDYSTLLNGADRYLSLANHYSELYERDWERLQSKADTAEDNTLEDEVAGSSVIRLSSGARSRRWRR
jgi:hypothetical protein